MACVNTSQNFDYSYDYGPTFTVPIDILSKIACTVSGIYIPLIIIGIYVLYLEIRNDNVVPIYIINLLVSDIIQLCCNIAVHVLSLHNAIAVQLYFLFASIGFMVCVALERFLVIVFPLWYRIRWTIKTSLLVCVMVWILALVPFLLLFFSPGYKVTSPILGTVFLLPCPLLVFFLGGTLSALSASVSVPADEKRRVVGMLVLVLLIYTLLFLPLAIFFLVPEHSIDGVLFIMSKISFCMSPFANLFLYIFMRKGVVDKLLASVCCYKVVNNDVNGPAV